MKLIKKILRTNIVWRLTGLTYPSAVVATNGYYLSKRELIEVGKEENRTLIKFLDKEKTLLEFGSGIGKNLFAIADKIKVGYGLDVNSLYCKLASRLAGRYNIHNVNFIHYDGKVFPKLPQFNIIYENGVFERIPKNLVKSYVTILKNIFLQDQGIMILYFLSENSKNTDFTKRLGDDAYVFWNKLEIEKLVNDLELMVVEIQEWPMAYVYALKNKVVGLS